MDENKEYRVCSRCGKQFIPDGRHRTICSERCKRSRGKQQPEKNPNADLIQLAVEARAAGMTYGEYVARREKERCNVEGKI